MRPQRNRDRDADQEAAAQMAQALEAERQGLPKRWFVIRENPRGGLKLGIGMFNPGICRVADMFYFGEPSAIIVSNAYLIAEAVSACVSVNPKHPRAAAAAYPSIIRACQNVLALELADARHDPLVREVIRLVRSSFDEARREV